MNKLYIVFGSGFESVIGSQGVQKAIEWTEVPLIKRGVDYELFLFDPEIHEPMILLEKQDGWNGYSIIKKSQFEQSK